MMIDDEFRVWGKTDGRGLVVRSEEPVDFHPINKTANVVRVDSLDDAVKWVNVATQTIGFYPFARMPDYRDRLASGGAQRIVQLGEAGPRSEEHTSELKSLMRISYAVLCLKKKTKKENT